MVPAVVEKLFQSRFGREPEIVVSAPGRVNLIGEHTDYNGGQVLPMGIVRRTFVAIGDAGTHRLSTVVSADQPGFEEFDITDPAKTGRWPDYVSGIGAVHSTPLPQVQIAIASDVPLGAGLSSSAALEVAVAGAIRELTGSRQSTRDLALDAWRVETSFVGVDCGIMDQFASGLSKNGHALHVWCDTTLTEDVPFEGWVLIFDTAVSRSLRGSAFNERRAECEEALRLLRVVVPDLSNLSAATEDQLRLANLPNPLSFRARHVVTETQRVTRAVAQLKSQGTVSGDLLYESHVSLRDLYDCSSPELDWFVERAMNFEGVEGARLTGAGWGGCAIATGNREALELAGAAIAHDYRREFNRSPRVWLTAADAGLRTEFPLPVASRR
ncbi:MAG TPA: galactokinase [Gemmatimonadaceae bacterium]|nr:galactokinase [Gemmatimonadaceae bacterium]